MELSHNLESVTTPKRGTGKGRPYCGGHTLYVKRVKDAISKAQNHMLVFELDILDGEYRNFFSQNPLKHFFVYEGKDGTEKFKELLQNFKKSNEGIITEEDIVGHEFDESKLNGLAIGGVLAEDNNGYLKVAFLCNAEYAESVGESSRYKNKRLARHNAESSDSNGGSAPVGFDELVN